MGKKDFNYWFDYWIDYRRPNGSGHTSKLAGLVIIFSIIYAFISFFK